jgi:hypothetical protein
MGGDDKLSKRIASVYEGDEGKDFLLWVRYFWTMAALVQEALKQGTPTSAQSYRSLAPSLRRPSRRRRSVVGGACCRGRR